MCTMNKWSYAAWKCHVPTCSSSNAGSDRYCSICYHERVISTPVAEYEDLISFLSRDKLLDFDPKWVSKNACGYQFALIVETYLDTEPSGFVFVDQPSPLPNSISLKIFDPASKQEKHISVPSLPDEFVDLTITKNHHIFVMTCDTIRICRFLWFQQNNSTQEIHSINDILSNRQTKRVKKVTYNSKTNTLHYSFFNNDLEILQIHLKTMKISVLLKSQSDDQSTPSTSSEEESLYTCDRWVHNESLLRTYKLPIRIAVSTKQEISLFLLNMFQQRNPGSSSKLFPGNRVCMASRKNYTLLSEVEKMMVSNNVPLYSNIKIDKWVIWNEIVYVVCMINMKKMILSCDLNIVNMKLDDENCVMVQWNVEKIGIEKGITLTI